MGAAGPEGCEEGRMVRGLGVLIKQTRGAEVLRVAEPLS